MLSSVIQRTFAGFDGLSRADRFISRAVSKNECLAVMIVNVGDVERISATIGHARTQDFLDEFHSELKFLLREKDAMERISDRKFAVILRGMKNQGLARIAAKRIEHLVIDVGDKGIFQQNLRASIGVAFYPAHATQASELMRLAEIASLGSHAGSDAVSFFEEDFANQLLGEWGLEGRLDNALRAGDLKMHFQPKICLATESIVGAEALMRWHDPELGPIPPDVFIKLAESTGKISALTQFAIQNVCMQMSEWKQRMPDIGIAVNVTPTTIISGEIVEVLRSATSIWDLQADQITLEVTENALMEYPEESHGVLVELREMGARVSIDDFGTGYSSLAYLKDIPADELKVDRSFVSGMLKDKDDLKIVEHTIQLARSFGLQVVAEGVACGGTMDMLRKLGCDYAQGYHIARPMPGRELESFIREFDNTAAK
jgi:diguanylate cyclase (GGDEF)-like protein